MEMLQPKVTKRGASILVNLPSFPRKILAIDIRLSFSDSSVLSSGIESSLKSLRRFRMVSLCLSISWEFAALKLYGSL